MTEASHGLAFKASSTKYFIDITTDEYLAIQRADTMGSDFLLYRLLELSFDVVECRYFLITPHRASVSVVILNSKDSEELRDQIGNAIRNQINRGLPAATPSEGPEPGSDEWIKSSVHYHPGDLA